MDSPWGGWKRFEAAGSVNSGRSGGGAAAGRRAVALRCRRTAVRPWWTAAPAARGRVSYGLLAGSRWTWLQCSEPAPLRVLALVRLSHKGFCSGRSPAPGARHPGSPCVSRRCAHGGRSMAWPARAGLEVM
ncbi:conserved hypothetical protein [Cupriavidus necator H16]|uniref:Uncharacterized protein n=1 Tax=Cupriavidus necator (strain ATCC 17699 / DSM 428 / KCTC 22496 / NCIMB 10442 / H16 / Stanier 337) TaxID=381666 RepID=Q0K574_CUPNH|nr:conserved hypothetical protein [Cupriavidus necator H16]